MDQSPHKDFTEYSFHKTYNITYKVKEVLYQGQSAFQKIEVFDTECVGRLLVLDGKTMVSDLDEFVYHEVMAHVPYMVSRKTKKVLVIGGGDGGVVREFVKHPEIEEIHLVEIDPEVTEVCRKFFPQCTSGLDDPRVTIHNTDGIDFIQKHQNEFDIITIDSTDPEDFATGLFTSDFYKSVNKALTADGLLVAQTENPFLDEYGISSIYGNLRQAFKVVESFSAPITIYPGVFWLFAFASKNHRGTDLALRKFKHMGALQEQLRWYNMDWHRGAFALSNFHRKKLGSTS